MKITVNSKEIETPDNITVAELIALLGETTQGIAVAVDSKVVKKDQWAARRLQTGDNVMLIKAAYGG